MPCNSKM